MKKFLSVLLLFIFSLTPVSVLAAGNGGGGGQGNGSGGGNNQPLSVESASVEDGGNISPEDGITLVFSKNVVNASVADTNKTLFTVMDNAGNSIPVEVVLADDQVEPDKKNDVVIRFPEGLEDGTYILTAQAGITAKSGDVLSEDYTLNFTVGAEDATSATTTEPTSDNASAAPETSANTETSSNTSTIIVIVVVIVVVVAGAVLLMRRKK